MTTDNNIDDFANAAACVMLVMPRMRRMVHLAGAGVNVRGWEQKKT